MASQALMRWRHAASLRLKNVEAARLAVGGRAAIQVLAAEQIKHAYVVLPSSHFQAFCRDLHTEAVDHLYPAVAPSAVQGIVKMLLTRNRMLDRGNPNAGNIGSDFNRFNFNFWQEVIAFDGKNADHQRQIDALNSWRNAVAHQDFAPSNLVGVARLDMAVIRKWQSACNRLASSFDGVISDRLAAIIGHRPW